MERPGRARRTRQASSTRPPAKRCFIRRVELAIVINPNKNWTNGEAKSVFFGSVRTPYRRAPPLLRCLRTSGQHMPTSLTSFISCHPRAVRPCLVTSRNRKHENSCISANRRRYPRAPNSTTLPSHRRTADLGSMPRRCFGLAKRRRGDLHCAVSPGTRHQLDVDNPHELHAQQRWHELDYFRSFQPTPMPIRPGVCRAFSAAVLTLLGQCSFGRTRQVSPYAASDAARQHSD